jgi:prepilin-type N-terminal cleavage/methylation domain-containing protein
VERSIVFHARCGTIRSGTRGTGTIQTWKKFKRSQRGFTLIELLVVIAILGVLAAVAVPNVGKFIGQGKQESHNAELHNLQTGIMAMMADYHADQLDAAYTDIADMSQISVVSNTANLTAYMVGLNADGTVKSGCT